MTQYIIHMFIKGKLRQEKYLFPRFMLRVLLNNFILQIADPAEFVDEFSKWCIKDFIFNLIELGRYTTSFGGYCSRRLFISCF